MEYINKAESLKSQNLNLDQLILEIRDYLVSHFKNLGKTYQAKSILESRFTPALIAFNIGLNSCGSKVNIATEMLRCIGYEVKKIHGSVPESADHAWIEAKDKKSGEWNGYDITKPDCKVASEHKIIARCRDLEDIGEDIQKTLISTS